MMAFIWVLARIHIDLQQFLEFTRQVSNKYNKTRPVHYTVRELCRIITDLHFHTYSVWCWPRWCDRKNHPFLLHSTNAGVAVAKR